MTLLALVAAWLAGTYVAVQLDATSPAIALFAVASGLSVALAASTRRLLLPSLMLIVLTLGVLRGSLTDLEPSSELHAYHGRQELTVEGRVASDPEAAGAATRFRFAVDQVTDDALSTEASGTVLVTSNASTDLARIRSRPYFRYGDHLRLDGALQAPPAFDDFDYPAYLARQGISTVMSFPDAILLAEDRGNAFYQWLYGVRRRIADSLAAVVPEPEASVGQALLLGIRDHITDALTDEFRTTGTAHILAVSGLHVGVLLGISLAASQGLLGRRRNLYLLAPLATLWLYALITGMSPSVTRAAVMGSVYLAALFFGRPRSVLPALAFAAAVMVAIDPRVLWSVSFQLSFTAVAGIALFAEPLSRRLKAPLGPYPGRGAALHVAASFVAELVAVTVAATIATLPLVVFYFRIIPLVGLPATLLVIPALPFVIVSQAAAGLLGVLSETVATPIGWIAWLATEYVTGVVGLFARLPGASVETGRLPSWPLWVYYGVMGLAYVTTTHRVRMLRLFRPLPNLVGARSVPGVPWWLLLPLIAGVALIWIAVLSLPDGKLHVAFIDVGQGDAVHVRTPSGRDILIDGGPDPLGAVRALGERLSFLDRHLDLVVLTHPHSDHVTGLLEVLDRYDVGRIVERRMAYESPAYESWSRAVTEEDAPVLQARPGQRITTGDGVIIEVVSPPEELLRGTPSDANNASIVLRLVYGDVSFLLTGDVFAGAEAALVARNAYLDSDVLKVAHHGSRSSSSGEFLDRVTPRVAVVSAGENNRFGHPHLETLVALRRHVPNDALFSTARNGTVEFITDGRRLAVKTER